MKVLHVLGGMGRGGAPSFVINNMMKMDSDLIVFDFLVRKDNCAFSREIKAQGGKVFTVSEFPRHIIKNYIETRNFFKSHVGEYDIVHIHANALLYILPIWLAKKYWKCKIIIHSHNTTSNLRWVSWIHFINQLLFLRPEYVRLACSQEAGKWMFGKRAFQIINNAVDAKRFQYSEMSRKRIREELMVEKDCTIVGNIGRIEAAKNHDFMIDVFSKYLQYDSNTVLVLVGEGSLKDSICKKISKCGLDNRVIWTGVRSDAPDLYSAFDIFLMPSFFEGLPFTLIEAQASGLKCVISGNITREVDLTDLIIRHNLNDSIEEWAKSMLGKKTSKKREDYVSDICEKQYDIYTTSKILENIYLENKYR